MCVVVPLEFVVDCAGDIRWLRGHLHTGPQAQMSQYVPRRHRKRLRNYYIVERSIDLSENNPETVGLMLVNPETMP